MSARTERVWEGSMKGLQRFSFVFFFVLVCFSAACFSAQAEGPVIKLKFASYMPPMHKVAITIEEAWCKEVEKGTNGSQGCLFPRGHARTGSSGIRGSR